MAGFTNVSLSRNFLRALLCAAGLSWLSVAELCAQQSPARPQASTAPPSWHYQLQGDLAHVRRSKADLAVVDSDHVAANGGTASLRPMANGHARRVISYLSIGEAESSRVWWAECCAAAPPAWLTTETQGWPGNFVVRYWHADWQSRIEKLLGDIIALGYDGVYLDRIDSWEAMTKERPTARADMIAFVLRLTRFAKSRKGEFLVFVQNGEELLEDKTYLAAIDGIAKEDLYFGAVRNGQPNPPEMVSHSIGLLERARRAGKLVLAVEYLAQGPDADAARANAAARGFGLIIAGRALDGSSEPGSSAAQGNGAVAPAGTVKAAPTVTAPTAAPQAWSAAEVDAARSQCSDLLKGKDVVWEVVPPIKEGACGTPAPIRVARVLGVELKPAPTVNCRMADVLHEWVRTVVVPASRELLGGPVTTLQVAASYDCRGRNGSSGGKLSEHATANAIDISAFSDGRQSVNVKDGWGTVQRLAVTAPKDQPAAQSMPAAAPERGRSGAVASGLRSAHGSAVTNAPPAAASAPPAPGAVDQRSFLRRIHEQSCKLFGTVLGPEANDAHLDHFHLDRAERMRSAYCQ